MISRLAARQHGVVARWQLIAAGVSRHQIDLRIAAGRFIQLHRGVYLAGTVAPEHAHEIAALLAYRLRATLSHRTAAQLWNLLPYPATAQAWVTVAPAVSAGRPRINVSRARLERRDVRRRHRMALTSPPRTILDCAALLSDPYELERLDFLWRAEWLAVEVDGYDAHSGRVAFERDRLKVAKLRAAGISVMPVTGRQVRRDPDGVVERLLAALRPRPGGRGGPAVVAGPGPAGNRA